MHTFILGSGKVSYKVPPGKTRLLAYVAKLCMYLSLMDVVCDVKRALVPLWIKHDPTNRNKPTLAIIIYTWMENCTFVY